MKKVGIHTAEAAGAGAVLGGISYGVYRLVKKCRQKEEAFRLEAAHKAIREGEAFDIGKKASDISDPELKSLAENYSKVHVVKFEDQTESVFNDEITKFLHKSASFKKLVTGHLKKDMREKFAEIKKSTILDRALEDQNIDPDFMEKIIDKTVAKAFEADANEPLTADETMMIDELNKSESFKQAYEEAWAALKDTSSGYMHAMLADHYYKLLKKSLNNKGDGAAHKFKVTLDSKILDHNLLKNINLEEKLRMIALGKVRETIPHYKKRYGIRVEEDLASGINRIEREIEERSKHQAMSDISEVRQTGDNFLNEEEKIEEIAL